MFDKVTIAYRGAKYEIGRGGAFYGIWVVGAPRSEPLQWWPETPEGWNAAWTRFASIEVPGTIVPVGRSTSPAGSGPAQAGTQTGTLAGARAGGRARTLIAAGLLGLGVVLGVVGLFPGYFGGAGLTQQAAQLIPHVFYLAVWAAAAVLVVLGGARLRVGALLSLGLSVVTFGLFVADAGTAIAGQASGGAGLVLSFLGWLACAAGSVLACLARPAGHPGQPGRRGALAPPRGAEIGPVVMVVLAGLGVAAAFAPAWDTFTLRTAAGPSQTLTAGNAFSNPGLVITGDVLAMIALAAVVAVAAFWRPVRHGGILLGGAVITMAGQAISALVGATQAPGASQFGISSAEASRLGLTITSGLTPAFWIYSAFLLVLAVSCAWMLFTPAAAPGPGPFTVAPPAAGPAGAAQAEAGPAGAGPAEADPAEAGHAGASNDAPDTEAAPTPAT